MHLQNQNTKNQKKSDSDIHLRNRLQKKIRTENLKIVIFRQSSEHSVFVPNVPALVDNVGIPQIPPQKQRKAKVRAEDRKEDADPAQMRRVLLRVVHTDAVDIGVRAVCPLHAVIVVVGRHEQLSARQRAFVLVAAPSAVRRPLLMARPLAARPCTIVAEYVPQRVRQNEGKGEPAKDRRAPLCLERVRVRIALARFVGDVDTQTAEHDDVDEEGYEVCGVTGSGGDRHAHEGQDECRPASCADECGNAEGHRADGHDQRLFALFGRLIASLVGSRGLLHDGLNVPCVDERRVFVHGLGL